MSLGASLFRDSSVRVPSSVQSNKGPAMPNTAVVLDYTCLFSHDLKRKQKRWQDGKLKFHTFNKRIMVYDERGNFIGDMHWREDYDLDEGEEFQLERGCVIVQVGDCTGSKQQDLSELIDKRYQDKEQRQARAAAAASTTPSRPGPRPPPPGAQQRPLTDLTTTPRANYIGRAVVPTKSPFEQRQAQIQEGDTQHERPAKRRKQDVSPPSKSGYAQNLFGTTLSLSAWSSQPSQTGRGSRGEETSETADPSDGPVQAPPSRQPVSRPRPPPSLLQSIRRDVVFGATTETEGSRGSLTARLPTGFKATEPPRHPRHELSHHQLVQQPARTPRNQRAELREAEGPGASRAVQKSTPRSGSSSERDERGDNSEPKVVETSSRSLHRIDGLGKRDNLAKETRSKPGPRPEMSAAHRKRTENPSKEPAAAKAAPSSNVEPSVSEEENAQERSRLISRAKPSRKRRLLMVASTNNVDPKPPPGDGGDMRRTVRVIPISSKATAGKSVAEVSVEASTEADCPSSSAGKAMLSMRAVGKRRSKLCSAPATKQTPKASSMTTPVVICSPIDPVEPDKGDSLHQSSGSAVVLLSDDSPHISDEDIAPAAPRRRRQPTTDAACSSDEDSVSKTNTNPVDAIRNPWLEKHYPFLPQGARLARIGPNIKSKEILGFRLEELQAPLIEASSPHQASSVHESPEPEQPAGSVTPEPADQPVNEFAAEESDAPQLGTRPQMEGDSSPADTKRDVPESGASSFNNGQSVLSSPVGAEVDDIIAESPPGEELHPPLVATPALEPHIPTNASPLRPASATVAEPGIEPEEIDAGAANSGEKDVAPEPTAIDHQPTQSCQSAEALPKVQPTIPREGSSEAKILGSSSTSTGAPAVEAPGCPGGDPERITSMPANPPFQAHRPRLVNPATRGRKAALRSDAAGQIPQTIVSVALPPPTIMNPPRRADPKEAQKATDAQPAPVTLPGFSRAGGGAWSKTAHDLLGMERPTT